jgi:hypothetical protein
VRLHCNTGAYLELHAFGGACSDALDAPNRFVTWNEFGQVAQRSLIPLDIGAADAATFDTDERLIGREVVRHRKFYVFEAPRAALNYCMCFHFCQFSSLTVDSLKCGPCFLSKWGANLGFDAFASVG